MTSGRTVTVAVNTLSVSSANEGIRTVLQCLLPALKRVAPDVHQVLVCSPANRHLFDDDAETILVELDHRRALRRIVADQVTLPRVIRGRADVLFTPSSVGTLFAPVPQVVFVQHHLALPSCQALAGSRSLGPAHRFYYGPLLRWSLRRAEAVLGNSRFVADGLVRELRIDEAKVAAMPLGVDQPVRTTLGKRAPLVLFVGTLYPYKAADVAVEAFAVARSGLPGDAELAIVGRDPDGRAIPALRALSRQLGVDQAVSILGSIPEIELDDLYNRASALVMPSRCEGFGLPVIEAMSHGVPVIAADTTALTEVTAGAGILVAPGDVDGFAAAITTLLTDRARGAELVDRGLQRAAEMTWDRTATYLRRAIEAVAP